MDGLKRLITDEPVMVQGLVQAGIAMLVGFGLGWTADQVALVLAFTATLLAVVARTFVTPTATFDAAVNREAESIASAIVADDRPLSDAELAMLDRQRDRLNAELDAEFRRRP